MEVSLGQREAGGEGLANLYRSSTEFTKCGGEKQNERRQKRNSSAGAGEVQQSSGALGRKVPREAGGVPISGGSL